MHRRKIVALIYARGERVSIDNHLQKLTPNVEFFVLPHLSSNSTRAVSLRPTNSASSVTMTKSAHD